MVGTGQGCCGTAASAAISFSPETCSCCCGHRALRGIAIARRLLLRKAVEGTEAGVSATQQPHGQQPGRKPLSSGQQNARAQDTTRRGQAGRVLSAAYASAPVMDLAAYLQWQPGDVGTLALGITLRPCAVGALEARTAGAGASAVDGEEDVLVAPRTT